MSLLVFVKISRVQDPVFEKWFPHIKVDNTVGFSFLCWLAILYPAVMRTTGVAIYFAYIVRINFLSKAIWFSVLTACF